jgi:hypothetical protein
MAAKEVSLVRSVLSDRGVDGSVYRKDTDQVIQTEAVFELLDLYPRLSIFVG